jgi:DNA-binding transcriptional MerR regulator
LSSIADLPDVPKYTIKTVCAQTGIQAVTLRAWERRYHLMRPRRTQGNYRLYSDRDVAMLRWLKHRVDEGVAISTAAAELAAMRRRGQLPEQPLAPLPEAAAPPAWRRCAKPTPYSTWLPSAWRCSRPAWWRSAPAGNAARSA